jgi:hypothetical protein
VSSVSMGTARELYGAEDEAGMLQNMAAAYGCRLIYKYANDFGDKVTHTDYKVVMAPGDDQDQGLRRSPYIHNLVLVYRDGEMVSEKI